MLALARIIAVPILGFFLAWGLQEGGIRDAGLQFFYILSIYVAAVILSYSAAVVLNRKRWNHAIAIPVTVGLLTLGFAWFGYADVLTTKQGNLSLPAPGSREVWALRDSVINMGIVAVLTFVSWIGFRVLRR